MEAKIDQKLSTTLTSSELSELRVFVARIEALGNVLCGPGFPRTSPGAIAIVHKADLVAHPGRYVKGYSM